MVVADNEIDETKKCRQEINDNFDSHSDAAIRRWAHCPMKHIQALLEATGCRHRASACVVLPRRPPWSTNLLKQHKTLTKHNF
jgi:hypothetical protein